MSDRLIKVLDMITEDMKNDPMEFDGQPFNGRTVAKCLGHQCAAIGALAKIMKTILESNKGR